MMTKVSVNLISILQPPPHPRTPSQKKNRPMVIRPRRIVSSGGSFQAALPYTVSKGAVNGYI
jgi:hypothetical protein